MRFQAKITREINAGKLIAIADVNVENAILLRGVKLIRGENGLFVSMPSTKWEDRFGETHYQDIFCPLTPEAKEEMLRSVRDAYIAFEGTLNRGNEKGSARARAEPAETVREDELPAWSDDGPREDEPSMDAPF